MNKVISSLVTKAPIQQISVWCFALAVSLELGSLDLEFIFP